MVTIDILGSCVTRDSFGLVKHNYKLNSYFPRSSLVSLYSKPVEIKKEDIVIKSQYQQKLIFQDMTKQFPRYIKETESDVLIIDFIDERLGLLKINDTYITKSHEVNNSNVRKLFQTVPLNVDQHFMQMWKNSAMKLIEDINSRSYKHIIIHKSYWKKTYINKDGEKCMFNEKERLEKIKFNNRMLAEMYSFIEENLPYVKTIEPDEFSADESHQWGLTPFHYELEYYKYFIKKLDEITNIVEKKSTAS
ncbi:DUF6270 domain-containing protein [Metabacillus halosaccharovorans]|uniref:DUF6270 domain-containing protein n=1 Tax=Metabacillus halosaccharovorans TaxID=930124 RepID=UPI002040BBA5|nr:DUF6270 domain-containing protein [Metabacillus halosaccharovorans]MCM3443783.1 DUF6270 domain-containing protein [Metabacillus halosaccharovorans]